MVFILKLKQIEFLKNKIEITNYYPLLESFYSECLLLLEQDREDAQIRLALSKILFKLNRIKEGREQIWLSYCLDSINDEINYEMLISDLLALKYENITNYLDNISYSTFKAITTLLVKALTNNSISLNLNAEKIDHLVVDWLEFF